MGWRQLFFATSWPRKGAFGEGVPTGTGVDGEEGSGTFITPGSIGTFAGATLAITALTTGVELIEPTWKVGQANINLMGVMAFCVGGVLFWVNSADKKRSPKSAPQWAVALLVALVNTIYLWCASLGIPLAIHKAETEQVAASGGPVTGGAGASAAH